MKASNSLARPFAVALGLGVLAIPAHAADVVFQEPPAPQPAAPMAMAPVDTWSGPYLGISVGYGFAGRVGTSDSIGERIRTDGWMGGVFGGFNFQDGMMVYGAEADLNYARLGGTNDLGDDARTRLDGSLRARLGVAVTDDILLYGTGGVAAERLRVTPNDPLLNSDTNMMVGLTGGVGMDARLTEEVFGRVEYRYTHYGSRNFDFGAAGGSESINSRNHRVSVGLGVRF